MEERIFFLHKLDNGYELLNIYIENLGNDLYIADSIIADKLIGKGKEQFTTFYNQKLTNLKDVNNIYLEQLSAFYNKKKKQHAKELTQLKASLAQKDRKELMRLNGLITQNRKDFQNNTKPKESPKTSLNNSIGSRLANRIPQRSVASARSYPAQWTSFGWKNIDAYLHLLNKGYETVEVKTKDNKGFSRVFQYLNTIKTVTPLLLNNNITNAKFPKSGTTAARQMNNTYCFNIAKKDEKYFWGKKAYNPYAQSKINVETDETLLAIIRQELQIAGKDGKASLNYFKTALDQEINRKKKQAENKKRMIEEQKKRDELLKSYKEKQAKIEAEIEIKRQEQQAENDFMNQLKCIAFPCYDNSSEIESNTINESWMIKE